MTKRLLSIALIWVLAATAWSVLGFTVIARTDASDSTLRTEVGSMWGTPQRQTAPTLTYDAPNSRLKPSQAPQSVALRLDGTDASAQFDLEYRRKGLLSYNTYAVAFRGAYVFLGDGSAHVAQLTFTFPSEHAVFDDFLLEVNGRPAAVVAAGNSVGVPIDVGPKATIDVVVSYHSRGLGSWTYDFGDHVAALRNVHVAMLTNFGSIDFPPDTLSPTTERRTASGWALDWTYRNLVSAYSIGLTMPQMMQPGPLAQRLTLWAPVSLLFFFVVLFVIATLRRIDLHPMNYAFLAAAFFAFHLLFAYSVDHISIPLAFALCSIVSVFLVVSYLRLVAGLRFAAFEAGLAQFIYLVLFSFALFFEGWSGLTITVGAIATLFVVMQVTGRVRWREVFAPRPLPL